MIRFWISVKLIFDYYKDTEIRPRKLTQVDKEKKM